MEQVLDKCHNPTVDMIINLIEIENAHINTNHPDFVCSADTLLNLFSGEQEMGNQDDQQNKKYSLLSNS